MSFTRYSLLHYASLTVPITRSSPHPFHRRPVGTGRWPDGTGDEVSNEWPKAWTGVSYHFTFAVSLSARERRPSCSAFGSRLRRVVRWRWTTWDKTERTRKRRDMSEKDWPRITSVLCSSLRLSYPRSVFHSLTVPLSLCRLVSSVYSPLRYATVSFTPFTRLRRDGGT